MLRRTHGAWWVLGIAALLGLIPAIDGRCDEYRMAPADSVEVSIFGEPDLFRELVVRPDGRVSFPLVGDLQVAGKTTTEVKQDLEQQIREYIPDASATVIVTKLGSLQFYVIGKVAKPGMFNVSKQMSALEALAMAGGTTPFADESKISIMRRVGDKTVRYPFDLKHLKQGENLDQNILLERGDVILVP